jgi:hypothetical protein
MGFKASIIAGMAVAVAALGAPGARAASGFQNGGFEDGLAHWVGDPDLVQIPAFGWNHLDADGEVDHHYDPVSPWTLAKLQASETDANVILSQTFSTGGGLFSGWAAFLGEDYLPWNDEGFVRIYRLTDGDLQAMGLASNPLTLFSSSISDVGDWGWTEWTHFQVRLDAGTYRVEAGILDRNDAFNPSVLLVDNFQMTPEPAAWALMILGFAGLGAALRRRRAFAG